MKITRDDYEAYLLDHLEGNLSEQESALLMAFLEENPDLDADFDLDLEGIQDLPTSNMIMFRGSDVHSQNFDFFKEPLIHLMEHTERYVWGFFGYTPEWVFDILPSERIKQYKHIEPHLYFKYMQQIRPELMYVLMKDTEFNRGRSCNAYYDSVLAGSKCVVPDLPEYRGTSPFSMTLINPIP